MLWRYPALLPAFETWPPVLQKLIGGAGMLLFLRSRLEQMFNTVHLDWYWVKYTLFPQRSDAARCGGAVSWSPRCETGRLLCCNISEQQVSYDKGFGKDFWQVPHRFGVTTFLWIAGLLLQLALLQCPVQRCTVWDWKGEECVFSTHTWIISGEWLPSFYWFQSCIFVNEWFCLQG